MSFESNDKWISVPLRWTRGRPKIKSVEGGGKEKDRRGRKKKEKLIRQEFDAVLRVCMCVLSALDWDVTRTSAALSTISNRPSVDPYSERTDGKRMWAKTCDRQLWRQLGFYVAGHGPSTGTFFFSIKKKRGTSFRIILFFCLPLLALSVPEYYAGWK